jgi:predicted metal-dependent HD superfamily phosphohydrolase
MGNQADINQQPGLDLTTMFPALARPEIILPFAEKIRDSYPDPDEFPFHNFRDHILPALESAARFIKALESAGYNVDHDVVVAAVLGHDACYEIHPRDQGLSSKEEVAQHHCKQILRDLGAPEEMVEKVARAIAATHMHYAPVSAEEKILRAIDLSGLNAAHTSFRSGSEKLQIEYQNARDITLSFNEFFRWQTAVVLAEYLLLEIKMTQGATDKAGRSLWHAGVVENIARCLNTGPCHAILGFSPAELHMLELQDTAKLNWLLQVADATGTRAALQPLKSFAQSVNSEALALVIPGNAASAPMPSGFVEQTHVLYTPMQFSWDEAWRVTERGGQVHMYVHESYNRAFLRELLQRQSRIEQPHKVSVLERAGYMVFVIEDVREPSPHPLEWMQHSSPDAPNFK